MILIFTFLGLIATTFSPWLRLSVDTKNPDLEENLENTDLKLTLRLKL